MVLSERVAVHRELLRRFDQTVRTNRTALAAASYEPVKILYSQEAIMLSQASYEAVPLHGGNPVAAAHPIRAAADGG